MVGVGARVGTSEVVGSGRWPWRNVLVGERNRGREAALRRNDDADGRDERGHDVRYAVRYERNMR